MLLANMILERGAHSNWAKNARILANYVMSILENFSKMRLASAISETNGAVAMKEITARDWAVMKTVVVASTPDLRVQAVRTILATPPFSAIVCASAASTSGMMRSIGIVNLPSRTAWA